MTGGSIVELLVLNLLVDDGLKGRGDRNAILSQDYGYIGAYVIEQQDSAIGVIVLSESKLQLLTGEELLSAQRSHMLSSQTKSGLKESFRRMKLPEEPLWTFQKVNSS